MRNAGQSDLTERKRERVERTDESGEPKRSRSRGDMGKSGTAEDWVLNTGRLCECETTDSLFVKRVLEQITDSVCLSFVSQQLQPSLVPWVAMRTHGWT